jgi:hypothetical protein
MHRALIGPIAAALIILLAGTVAWLVRSSMIADVQTSVEAQAQRARGQFDGSIKARGFNLMGDAQSFSNSDDVKAVFTDDPKADQAKKGGQRYDGYVAVEGEAAALTQKYDGVVPHMVIILGPDGKVVVRSEDQNFHHVGDALAQMEPSSAQSLAAALPQCAGSQPGSGASCEAKVTFDVWNFEGKMVLTGTSPVYGEDAKGNRAVLGAVVVGLDLSMAQAESDAELLNGSVAYFLDQKVQSDYFLSEGKEDADLANALSSSLFGAAGANTDAVHLNLSGDDYLAVTTWLPQLNKKTAGAALLFDVTAAIQPANRAALAVAIVGAIALVILLVALLIATRHFLHAIDDIETGLEQVIAGNTEYMFNTEMTEMEGTANALNVVLARLIPGRPEGDEDEEGVGRLAQVAVDDVDQAALSQAQGGQAAVDPETLRLAQEPEADYFKRLFGEYTSAKKAKGEDASDQTFESFVAKLRLSEGSLKKKYNCRAVRFRVLTRDGQVTLKPVPIY